MERTTTLEDDVRKVQQARINKWRFKQLQPRPLPVPVPKKAMSELQAFLAEYHGDSWNPATIWPRPESDLDMPIGEQPREQDCTCGKGEKLNCPVHGMQAANPSFEHTYDIKNSNDPADYENRADGPRSWMRAQTSTQHDINWTPGNYGKWGLDENGRVIAWNTDEMGVPHHMEQFIDTYGSVPEGPDEEWYLSKYPVPLVGEITPEGVIRGVNQWRPDLDYPRALDIVKHALPGSSIHEGWEFTGRLTLAQRAAAWDKSENEMTDEEKEYTRLSHAHGWMRGRPGKGIVTPEGTIYTWTVDQEGAPHHIEYLNRHQPYQVDEGMGHFFKITPRGILDTKGYDIPPHIIDIVLKSDSRLRAGEKTDWHFPDATLASWVEPTLQQDSRSVQLAESRSPLMNSVAAQIVEESLTPTASRAKKSVSSNGDKSAEQKSLITTQTALTNVQNAESHDSSSWTSTTSVGEEPKNDADMAQAVQANRLRAPIHDSSGKDSRLDIASSAATATGSSGLSAKGAKKVERTSFAHVLAGWKERMAADKVDTREYPDTRMMPATTMDQPAQQAPHPESKGCTCSEGHKLDCPVHGMHPDGAQQKYDHSWHIPEGQPVGYPESQPQNYIKAEGRARNNDRNLGSRPRGVDDDSKLAREALTIDSFQESTDHRYRSDQGSIPGQASRPYQQETGRSHPNEDQRRYLARRKQGNQDCWGFDSGDEKTPTSDRGDVWTSHASSFDPDANSRTILSDHDEADIPVSESDSRNHIGKGSDERFSFREEALPAQQGAQTEYQQGSRDEVFLASPCSVADAQDQPKNYMVNTGAWHFGFPVSPEFWENGPREFFHGTSRERLPSIMEHGLHPWDSPTIGGSNYGNPSYDEDDYNPDPEQWLVPRPGHVYLSQDPYDAHYKGFNAEIGQLPIGTNVEEHLSRKPVVIRVDPRYLRPEHINPDEDRMLPRGNSEQYPGYHSLGEMAERMGWGDVAADTEREIGRGHSIGYRGVIPPEALTPGTYDNGVWRPLDEARVANGVKVHEIEPGGEPGTHDMTEEEWKANGGKGSDAQRKPFIYVPEHKTIYLGNPGWYHDDVDDAIFGIVQRTDQPKPLAIPGIIEPDGSAMVFDVTGNTPRHEADIYGALGGQAWQPTTPGGWQFTAKPKPESEKQGKLWVDDTRRPPSDGWDWARNVHDAINKAKAEDYMHMSLDHDLALTKYKGKVVVNPSALNGADFAVWLHEHGDKKRMPASVNIHTHNDAAVEIMRSILEPHCEVTVERAPDELEEEWARQYKVHEPSEIREEAVHLPERVAPTTHEAEWSFAAVPEPEVEHEDNLEGGHVQMPEEPAAIRKKRKERQDQELIEESEGAAQGLNAQGLPRAEGHRLLDSAV